MVTVITLIVVLMVVSLYGGCALLYLHRHSIRRMDFFDVLRRVGPAGERFAIALACLLLLLGIGLEWRLPLLVLAVTITSIGMTRDVYRERKKRKAAR